MNKRELYENIMNNVAKQVKRALFENKSVDPFYNNLLIQLDNLFNDYDMTESVEKLCISQYELAFSNTQIDYIVLIRESELSVEFWAGDPEDDDNAEELIIPPHIQNRIIKLILRYENE